MGIKGLMTYIKSMEIVPEEIPSGSVLLVDGCGWCFQLMQTLDESYEQSIPQCSLLAGLYSDFDAIIKQHVEYLRDTLGLTVIVFMDGSITRMKDATAEKRMLERQEYWMNLVNTIMLQRLDKTSKLPLPRMCFEQFVHSLRTLSVQTIQCEEEADGYIAKAVASFNTDADMAARRFFCYGRDSDFLAFAACPYIELDSLARHGDSLFAVVYQRDALAAAMGLTETQFIDLCILLGNDYTSHFPRTDFLASLGLPRAANDVETLLQTVRELPCALSSSIELYQQAIDFSRQLYDLQDTSHYPEDVAEFEEPNRLSRADKASVDEWISLALDTDTLAATASDAIGLFAIEYLHNYRSVYPKVKDLQFEALQSMLHQLAHSKQQSAPVPLFFFRAIAWEDVELATLYQNICQRITRAPHLQAHLKPAQTDPRRSFDGFVFFSVLQRLRQPPPAPQSVQSLTKNMVAMSISGTDNPYNSSSSSALLKLLKSNAPPTVAAPETTPSKPDVLPIDAYKEEILRRVERDRVVIIHGETGCGKSSRLPVMLLEHAEATGRPFHLVASQPRRIAASSLMKRLRTTLGSKVGMRMGHGIKDEYDDTKLFFVTTGYLVRLLAHRPDYFLSHTHLVVDEVHERSVDSDVLLYLCKRLLEIHSTIRIILMSATIHTELYKSYFTTETAYYGDMECLSVGVRRFPLNILGIEDIIEAAKGAYTPTTPTDMNLHLPHAMGIISTKILGLLKNCRGKFEENVPAALAKEQYALVVGIVKSVAVNGTGILVFVSGIADITELSERFEGMPRFKVIAIHSDIPFEEQEAAFLPAKPDEVKVILATNAAESSITLPDVDTVICLGTHKSLRYEASSHRVQLVNTWVSKASATQRAGRTGRVRPGNVFRLYSNALFGNFQDHEVSEVLRQPLQDVILKLKTMLENSEAIEGVVPVLMNLIEPPDMSNVEKSFNYLYDAGMISTADDYGQLTETGKLAGSLPVDIQLSRLIAYGINLGIGTEACIMAAALSLPKTLFRIASPLIHTDPDEYNEIVQQTFLAAVKLDEGIYSEPIMMLKTFLHYRDVPGESKFKWALDRGMAHARMKLFNSMVVHLIQRVNGSLAPGETPLDVSKTEQPSKTTINRLRLLLLWTSEGNILRMKTLGGGSLSSDIIFTSGAMTKTAIQKLLPASIEYRFINIGKRIYDAMFSSQRMNDSLVNILNDLARVGLSHNASVVWLHKKDSSDDDDDGGQQKAAKGKKLKMVESVIIFAVFESRSASCVQLLQRLFDPNQLQFTNQYTENLSYSVVVANAPTKRQNKALRDLHEQLDCSLSIMIPLVGSAKVTASNCIPTSNELDLLFFGEGCFDRNHISTNILASKQAVSFTDIPKPQDKLAMYDFPLGYRLLSTYRLGYKDRMLRIANEAGKAAAASGVVVGSQQWSQQKDQLSPAVDDRNVIVSCNAAVGSWDNIQQHAGGPPIKAVISAQAFLATSVHRGPEPLYGIAHDTLAAGSEGRMVFCRGVSFLPPGDKWIMLAHACIDRHFATSSSRQQESKHGKSDGDDDDGDNLTFHLCTEVAALLFDLRDAPVQAYDELGGLVDEIFAAWSRNENAAPSVPKKIKTRDSDARQQRQVDRQKALQQQQQNQQQQAKADKKAKALQQQQEQQQAKAEKKAKALQQQQEQQQAKAAKKDKAKNGGKTETPAPKSKATVVVVPKAAVVVSKVASKVGVKQQKAVVIKKTQKKSLLPALNTLDDLGDSDYSDDDDSAFYEDEGFADVADLEAFLEDTEDYLMENVPPTAGGHNKQSTGSSRGKGGGGKGA